MNKNSEIVCDTDCNTIANTLSNEDTKTLFEKAALVQTRIDELRERLDESVFTGESHSGCFRISLYGDGQPAAVEIRMELEEDGKKLFEGEIFQALEAAFRSRVAALDNGLKAIQEEAGVGPDFKMPF